MISKDLVQIKNTRTSELGQIVPNWQLYTPETVVLAYMDSKRRLIQMNSDFQFGLKSFEESQQKNIEELSREFLSSKNAVTYEELFAKETTPVYDAKTLQMKNEARQAYQTNHKANQGKAVRDMVIGGIFLIGGLIITFASMSSGGGSYIVTYGAIIFGLIRFITGVVSYSSN